MIQIKESSNSVVSWTLLLVVLVTLSGCSYFVGLTQDNILDQPISTHLNFYISKSKKVLACVKKHGGSCPDDVAVRKTAITAIEQAAEKASKSIPAYRADAIKDLLEKTPITIEGIKKGMLTGHHSGSVGEAQKKAAEFAYAAITNETNVGLEELYDMAIGTQNLDSVKPSKISKSEAAKYAKSIQDATNFDGWRSFRFYLQGQLADKKSKSNKSLDDRPQIMALEQEIRGLKVIEAYLTAYFENGDFFSLDIEVTELTIDKIQNLLKTEFNLKFDEQVRELSVKFLTAIIGSQPVGTKYHILTKKKDGGFVTRGGTKYVFPGLSINIDPLSANLLQVEKIDFTQVGSDVVRVFLEAEFDALGQLPADQTSTACEAIKAGQFTDYPDFKCYVETETDKTVKATEFTKVNDLASQAESLAATATGLVIRGVSWISINNEALAKLIETAVGVAARKATEKVAWCVYACIPGENREPAFRIDDGDIRTTPLSFVK